MSATLTIAGTPQVGDVVTVTLRSQRKNRIVRWWQTLRRRGVVTYVVRPGELPVAVALEVAMAINARKLGVFAVAYNDAVVEIV